MEAELEACEGRVLMRRELRPSEVDGSGGPVPAGLEHERQPEVSVRGPGESGGHVQRHLQRLRRPNVEKLPPPNVIRYGHTYPLLVFMFT